MGQEETDALINDVWHFAERGMPMPLRYNIGSTMSNLADRLRPDWILHKKRIGTEKIKLFWKHDARSLVSTGVGLGASGGGMAAGHAIATAAGLTVTGAVLGMAATTGIGIAAGAVLGIGVIAVKSKVESSNRKGIYDRLKDKTASEKELYYLLSHGELNDLARSFEKAHKAEDLYEKEAARWAAHHVENVDCIQTLKLTYALLYWKKRLKAALLQSPRLLALKQFKELIEDKMIDGLEHIMKAQTKLLEYANLYGQEIATLHPSEFRKAPELPDDSFFQWRENTEKLNGVQKRGLALLLAKTRPSKLSSKALNTLGELAAKAKENAGNDPQQLPVMLVKGVGAGFLAKVVANATAGAVLRAGMSGAAGGVIAGRGLIGGATGFVISVPLELVTAHIANCLNDRKNLEYLQNEQNNVEEKVYRLRSILEHGRVAAIHDGYKALDTGCTRLDARFNEPLRGGDDGFRLAVEISKHMQVGIEQFLIMQSMMLFVGTMLELIELGAEQCKERYGFRKNQFTHDLLRQQNGSHDDCVGNCYSAENYHPLRA